MDIKFAIKGGFTLFTKRYCGPFWYRRGWLKKTQWLSQQELEGLQIVLLKKTLQCACDSVPFYRELLSKNDIRLDKIHIPTDITCFPVLTKEEVLAAGKSIIRPKRPYMIYRKAYTGGTTGTPMEIYRDLFSISTEHAFVRRQFDWAGIGMKDRCAYLTGRLIAKPDQSEVKLHRYDPLMKELILSTYHLSKETARDYLDIMNQFKVKAITGYPSAVSFLARVALDTGKDMPLQAALTSSETLSSEMRETIEKAFHCQVYDFYGSAERVCYIFTCEKGNYHLNPEYGLTELIPIDENNPERCKVVSTGFWNRAMPLIRYELGDIVIKSNQVCSCGREFPVVKEIEGRQTAGIRTPSGREFGAAILTHLLYGTGHILESQIIQDDLDHISIEYVPAPSFTTEDLQAFDNLFKMHIPSELQVTFKKVDAVKRTKSGKILPVVSLIK